MNTNFLVAALTRRPFLPFTLVNPNGQRFTITDPAEVSIELEPRKAPEPIDNPWQDPSNPCKDGLPSATPPGHTTDYSWPIKPAAQSPAYPHTPPPATELPKPPKMKESSCPPSTEDRKKDCLPFYHPPNGVWWIEDPKTGCSPELPSGEYNGNPAYASLRQAFDLESLRWAGGVPIAEAVALGWSKMHFWVQYSTARHFQRLLKRLGYPHSIITRRDCQAILEQEYQRRREANNAQKRKRRALKPRSRPQVKS